MVYWGLKGVGVQGPFLLINRNSISTRAGQGGVVSCSATHLVGFRIHHPGGPVNFVRPSSFAFRPTRWRMRRSGRDLGSSWIAKLVPAFDQHNASVSLCFTLSNRRMRLILPSSLAHPEPTSGLFLSRSASQLTSTPTQTEVTRSPSRPTAHQLR